MKSSWSSLITGPIGLKGGFMNNYIAQSTVVLFKFMKRIFIDVIWMPFPNSCAKIDYEFIEPETSNLRCNINVDYYNCNCSTI